MLAAGILLATTTARSSTLACAEQHMSYRQSTPDPHPRTGVHMPFIRVSGALAILLIVGARPGRSADTLSITTTRRLEPDACALLTEADVTKAIEVKALPGKRIVPSSPKVCGWSDVDGGDINHRRVTAAYTSVTGFQVAKSQPGRMSIEPISGIGDDAYYAIPKSESPILSVRKGDTAIRIRLLNGLKLPPFTLEQEKTKEADLAKAAVARL
jgi:hypothetical protein